MLKSRLPLGVLLIATITVALSLTGCPPSSTTVTVPNAVGMSQANAQSAITAAGLTVGTVTQQYSATVPSGQVIGQNPTAGASAASGSAVNLVVSTSVTVPNVAGLPQATAQSALASAGLVVGLITTEASATVAADLVIRQNPPAGTVVQQGTAIALVLSTGPAMVTAPNVVGATRQDAESSIQTAGLVVGSVTNESSTTAPAGSIIRQSPVAGTRVVSGSPVDLVVSTGPVTVSVPNVVGTAQAAAQTEIAAAQLTAGALAEQHSDQVQRGFVIGQTPAAGAMTAPGTAVNLVISLGPAPSDSGPATVVFDNRNAQAALPGPTVDTAFTISSAVRITTLMAWHAVEDANPDTISTLAIRDASGIQYGPWPMEESADGQVTAWTASTQLVLQPGTYMVIDSKPESWLCNQTSSSAGFARVEGYPLVQAGSAQIGVEGGEISGEGAQIAIPPGALDAPAQFVVTVGGAPAPSGMGPLYCIDGLPVRLNSAITVQLPLDVIPDGDVWVSQFSHRFRSNGTLLASDNYLLPARVVDSMVEVEIPAYDITDMMEGAKAVASSSMGLSVVTGFTSNLSKAGPGDFRIIYPAVYSTNDTLLQRIDAMVGLFQEAFGYLTTNFDMTFRNRTRWPMIISIGTSASPLADGVYGTATQSLWSRNGDSIELNNALFETTTNMVDWRATVIHELFHLLQYNYVPMGLIFNNPKYGNQAGEGGWLYDASSTASEWPFDGRAGHWPSTINQNGGLFPINGLLRARTSRVQPGDGQTIATAHGYAAGLFFHYMFNNRAVDYGFFGRLWRGLANGYPASRAINDACNYSLASHWNDFSQALYSGQLRSWNEVGAFLDPLVLAASVGVVPGAYLKCKDFDDALGGGTFAIKYPPMSAVVHTVFLNFNVRDLNPFTQGLVRVTARNMTPSLTATMWRQVDNKLPPSPIPALGYPGANILVNDTPVFMSTTAGATNDLAYGGWLNAVLYIVVTNDAESLDAQPVDASFECRFGSYPSLAELQSQTTWCFMNVTGEMGAGSPVTLAFPYRRGLFTWSGSTFDYNGAFPLETYQTHGVMHSSGAYVSAVVGSDAVDSEDGNYHYVRNMNFVYLPFQEWVGTQAVYGVTGANGLANIVSADETRTNIATGEASQTFSLDALSTLGRVYISFTP